MTYEYACTGCGHAWEAEQSISAPALTECPSCKQATAKRQVSGGAGFILKGGGWYADLYSSSSAKRPSEGSGESASSESKSSEGKSNESKSSESKSGDKPKTDAAPAAASTTSSSTTGGAASTGSKSTGAASS